MAEAEIIDKESENTNLLTLSRYPKVTDDGKIETFPFLEACRSVINLYTNLGSTLLVVKKDMLGNVEKLTKTYNKSQEKYRYINDLVLYEKDDKSLFAVDALLWLKRALEFTLCVIQNFIAESRTDPKSESVNHIVEDAYTRILKQHHNWLVQNIFKVLIKAFPYRSDILNAIKTCYAGKNDSLSEILDATELYFFELETNLTVIIKLYEDLKLETKMEPKT